MYDARQGVGFFYIIVSSFGLVAFSVSVARVSKILLVWGCVWFFFFFLKLHYASIHYRKKHGKI